MHKIIIILTLFIPFALSAQKNPIADFNSNAFWAKTKLITHLPAYKVSVDDSAMVVISNRKLSDDPARYVSEHREESGLHYYFVFTHNGIWNVLPVESIERAVQYMPDQNRDWVLYTEGMGKLFTTDLFRGLCLADEYKVNVVMFDYPSITTSKKSLGNYFFAIGNARIAYKYFAPAFVEIKKLRAANKMGTGHLTMLFHSMGNHVARGMVLHHKLEAINDTTWVDNLVLNAPCVQRRGHKKWVDKILYAKHIYINYNNNDFTLGGAYLVSKRMQLGQRPVINISKKATYINFNSICGQNHSNFLTLKGIQQCKPGCMIYYNTILHGDTVNVHDTKTFMASHYKHIGWEFVP